MNWNFEADGVCVCACARVEPARCHTGKNDLIELSLWNSMDVKQGDRGAQVTYYDNAFLSESEWHVAIV